MNEHEETIAKRKEQSRDATARANKKKREAPKSVLKEIKILYVVQKNEFMPVGLFNQEGGVGKTFQKHFEADPMCQYDYLDVHGILEPEKTDERTSLSSWMGTDWDAEKLKEHFSFGFFTEGEETGKHTVPSTNHVLGAVFKKYMKDRCGSEGGSKVTVAFTLDTSLEKGIKANRDRLAEFIGANFDCVHLSDDASFFGKPAHPMQAGKCFADTFYQFMAYDVSQKWWTPVYPPLKLVHLLNNKEKRDTAIGSKYKLPRAKFWIVSDGTNGEGRVKKQGPWCGIFKEAVTELEKHANEADWSYYTKQAYLRKNGVVGKPVEGCSGHGTIFLTKPDRGPVVARGMKGKEIGTVAQLLGQSTGEGSVGSGTGGEQPAQSGQPVMKKQYTFEPFVESCREKETRVFVERAMAGSWKCRYYMETKLDDNGKIISASPRGAADDGIGQLVMDVMKELEKQIGKDWTAYTSLIFRVDVFKLPILNRYVVNGIELSPLANSFAGCGDQYDGIFEMLNEAFHSFMLKNVGKADF